MKHAILSPSKSSRWLVCTPSARLEEKTERTSNEAADEGTLAHAISELLLLRGLHRIAAKKADTQAIQLKKNPLFNRAMLEHCEQFVTFVFEKYYEMEEKYGHAHMFLETNLDLSTYIPEGFGTGDVIIVAGPVIIIIDLKYGKGISVQAEENTQMMIYALGALDTLDMLFDKIKNVEMTIYQPRLDNISTHKMTAANLLEWGKGVLKGRAKLAFAGKGKFEAGSHCQFCSVKATCKANAAYNMELAKEEFHDPAHLKDVELTKIYLRATEIKSWLASIEAYMLERAVAGKIWKGLKLVHGRSSRIITDPEAVMKLLKRKKLPTNLFMSEPTLLGITALEQNIGANEFGKMAGKFVEKPKGRPSLVKADDHRQEYSSQKSAKDEFKNF